MIDYYLIQIVRVNIGQEFKSYSDLCSYIGIPVTKGKQRQLDQRHLQCYFTWEKIAGSNRLVITDTFYDAPKPFEDNRKGIHTTEFGGVMQNLILSTPWQPNELISKGKMLERMNLIRAGPSATLEIDCEEEENFEHIKRQPKDDYRRKLNSLLDSACEQLRKKGYAEINSVVANPKTKYVLSEQEFQKFNEIWKNTLGLFGAFHIGVIYQRRQEKEFWQSLNYATETNEILHQAPLRKLMQIASIKSEVAESVDRLAYLYGIRDTLIANYISWYQQKTSPGIGICRNSDLNSPIPPEIYKNDLNFFLKPLIINLQSGP